jgi:hypothetical protein
MLRILKISALVSMVILLNAVTTLLFVQNAVPASAGPQSGNCVTGDVNGDFTVDITDPIHLLGYIFEGTPEPVACAQAPAGITATELDSVLQKYFRSPEDAVSIHLDNLLLNEVNSVFSPIGKRFWITRLTIDCCFSPCPTAQVFVNGVFVGSTGNSFPGSWFDGYLLEPGDVLEVTPLSNCNMKFGGYYID